LSDRLDERLFRTLYASSLVYNTCWEDPAVDRQAFNLTPEDVLLVITSAGCNVLDYALLAPKRIHAVDAMAPGNGGCGGAGSLMMGCGCQGPMLHLRCMGS
jgi:S-adenosylmethionine:diacylglycerol 3-amino-3-carboxypropyl transferase